MTSGELPHLLFYGPPGTGKTSMIMAVASELFGELTKDKVMELNASDERGIDVVRNKIKVFAQMATSRGTAERPVPEYKLIVLDEADAMTESAQAALRRVIEDFSSVTRFCLICNYVSRIIDPLASRCAKFRFKPLSEACMLSRINLVAAGEGLTLDAGAGAALIAAADGDLRRAITLMQSAATLAAGGNTISTAVIDSLSGLLPLPVVAGLVAACREAASQHRIEAIESAVDHVLLEAYPASNAVRQLRGAVLDDATLPDAAKSEACLHFAEVDKRLVDGADERIQLLHLLSILSGVMAAAS